MVDESPQPKPQPGIAPKRPPHAPRAAGPQAASREPSIPKGRIAAPSRRVEKRISPSESPKGEVLTTLEYFGCTLLVGQERYELGGARETEPKKEKAIPRTVEWLDVNLPAERSRRQQDRMVAKEVEITHECEDFGRPTVFIGSSKEGQNIAEALKANMDEYCEATIWSQGAFRLGESNLEALVRLKDEFDFAILVLTPDDLSESRGERSNSPRDNVLFELGLFMGSLGRERTFAIYDQTAPMKLPSDLAGISLVTYIPYSTGNLQSALGTPCFHLKRAIKDRGRK